jgi:hypothetical protein
MAHNIQRIQRPELHSTTLFSSEFMAQSRGMAWLTKKDVVLSWTGLVAKRTRRAWRYFALGENPREDRSLVAAMGQPTLKPHLLTWWVSAVFSYLRSVRSGPIICRVPTTATRMSPVAQVPS